MDQYTLIWPLDFDDYSWELESKGWFTGLEVEVNGRKIRPAFYDSVRLSQDIAEELPVNGYFAESFIVVVDRVCRKSIENAILNLAKTGELTRLVSHHRL